MRKVSQAERMEVQRQHHNIPPEPAENVLVHKPYGDEFAGPAGAQTVSNGVCRSILPSCSGPLLPFRMALALGLALLATSQRALAKDYYLTLAGGDTPRSMAPSMYQRVDQLNRLLDSAAGAVEHDLLLSGGRETAGAGHRAPEQIPLTETQQQALEKLQRLLGKSAPAPASSPEPSELDGALTKENLRHWFDRVGSQLESGDRLTLVVLTHGLLVAQEGEPGRAEISLWQGGQLTPQELRPLLDRLPAGMPVRLMMNQCYAGGFAPLLLDINSGSDGKSPLICGFFATASDRPSVGCTSGDAQGPPQSYAFHFFRAATATGPRTGRRLADYDANGRVSLAEAHAFALVEAVSIDTPLQTSDAWLDRFAQRHHLARERKGFVDVDIQTLLAAATGAEDAVLRGLSQRLELVERRRIKFARHQADRLERRLRQLDFEFRSMSGTYQGLRQKARQALLDRWPELPALKRREQARWIVQHAKDFSRWAGENGAFQAAYEQWRETERIAQRQLHMERRWAALQRFLRTAESILWRQQLARLGSRAERAEFARLLHCERQPLLPEGADPQHRAKK